jgi:hypothetical protein
VAFGAFVLTEPHAQRSVCQGPRRRRQGAGVCRVEVAREEIEQLGILGQQRRCPGEQWDRVAPCDICEQGQDFVAGPVAAETRLGIGGVGDHLEAQPCDQSHGFGTPQG